MKKEVALLGNVQGRKRQIDQSAKYFM